MLIPIPLGERSVLPLRQPWTGSALVHSALASLVPWITCVTLALGCQERTRSQPPADDGSAPPVSASSLGASGPRERVRGQMAWIHTTVFNNSLSKEGDKCRAENDLRSKGLLPQESLQDPWGKAIQSRCKGLRIELRSWGDDRKPNTKDDICYPYSCDTDDEAPWC